MKLNFLNINLLLLLQFFHKAAADGTDGVKMNCDYVKPTKESVIGMIVLEIDPLKTASFSYLVYGPGMIDFSLGNETGFIVNNENGKTVYTGSFRPRNSTDNFLYFILAGGAGEYCVLTRPLYANNSDYNVDVDFTNDTRTVDKVVSSSASRTNFVHYIFISVSAVLLFCFNLFL
ncbi:hypothetical protein SJAG_00780 [Schizosaccharomyces japonicus yFS275]|uniref:Uncharacterized protein n=1 Tax=Schizosaccharomyces japonicus (strain yFS275 / FY16936) TaxID=402676 RepID=B6JWK3_SCHJY|nr:hypothetical protein SJAG_00780 [Schizosaccharomyces japonicus yFS275]EEB05754.2 hypothetical protein SJAG_00780 [Schizosaccharomyces japonicus yFS275]